jgi:hypothetical protein
MMFLLERNKKIGWVRPNYNGLSSKHSGISSVKLIEESLRYLWF